MKNADKIAVPKHVLAGITMIRDSGLTNMFDILVVLKILLAINDNETHDWIASHRQEYSEGIFKGFREE